MMLCNCCKPKNVARQVEEVFFQLQPTSNFSLNTIATQVAKKITPCNTNCRARFYFFPNVGDKLQGKLYRVTVYYNILVNCLQYRNTGCPKKVMVFDQQ